MLLASVLLALFALGAYFTIKNLLAANKARTEEARQELVALSKATAPEQPKWTIEAATADINGIKAVSASLEADNSKSEIELRKRGRTFEVILAADEFVGLEGSTVRWKVDSGKIRAEHWNSSTDGTGLFSSNPYQFLGAISHGGHLTLEYKPLDYLPITLQFSLPPAIPDDFQPLLAHVPEVVAQQQAASGKAEIHQRYRECMGTPGTTQKDCDALLTTLESCLVEHPTEYCQHLFATR